MATLVTAATKLRNSPGPLYLHITTLRRRRIRSGEWPLGQKVPILEELAREFGVARVTVRQAMGVLEGEGLIWRKQGKGTFVEKNILSGPWFSLQTEWSSLVKMTGFGDTAIELRKVRAGEKAPPLGASDGKPAAAYRDMQRVHSKDDIPYAVIDIYLDRRIYLNESPERVFATSCHIRSRDDSAPEDWNRETAAHHRHRGHGGRRAAPRAR